GAAASLAAGVARCRLSDFSPTGRAYRRGRPVMWDQARTRWPGPVGYGSMTGMTAAVVRRFVARRHVDYGRVRSAICPVH
ncbi:hypothetical protein ACFQZ8_13665, partial [Micromonospora azadirachtae]